MEELASINVIKRRQWALVSMRALATLMVVYGAIHVLQAIGSAYGYSQVGPGNSFFNQLLSVFWEANYNPFWYGLGLACCGIVLGRASRWLSRWIVPVVLHECPACGYVLRHLTTTRCPECGYELQARGDPTKSN